MTSHDSFVSYISGYQSENDREKIICVNKHKECYRGGGRRNFIVLYPNTVMISISSKTIRPAVYLMKNLGTVKFTGK